MQQYDYPIEIFYSQEDGGYIANIPDLKYCSAYGETPAEALHELELARSAWIESAQALGKPIPQPTQPANLHITLHMSPSKAEPLLATWQQILAEEHVR